MFRTDVGSFLGSAILRGLTFHLDRVWLDVLVVAFVALLPEKPVQLFDLFLYAIFLTLLLAVVKDFTVACLTGEWSIIPKELDSNLVGGGSGQAAPLSNPQQEAKQVMSEQAKKTNASFYASSRRR